MAFVQRGSPAVSGHTNSSRDKGHSQSPCRPGGLPPPRRDTRSPREATRAEKGFCPLALADPARLPGASVPASTRLCSVCTPCFSPVSVVMGDRFGLSPPYLSGLRFLFCKRWWWSLKHAPWGQGGVGGGGRRSGLRSAGQRLDLSLPGILWFIKEKGKKKITQPQTCHF